MLPLKESFTPYENAMAVYIEPDLELIWQDKMQMKDKKNNISLLNVFGRNEPQYGFALPPFVTFFDEEADRQDD